MRDRDKFRGCLIGGAAGDALGYAVEFLSEDRIFGAYGPGGITEYELYHGVAQISDDTQMTLFTAAGLLLGKQRGADAAHLSLYPAAVNDAYLDWLKTQSQPEPVPEAERFTSLAGVPELYSRRAPGNSCLAALWAGGGGTPENPINNSKGCGGVMRTAPVGLYFADRGLTAGQVALLGAQAAALTHGHPLGWMPGGMLSQIVWELVQNGVSLEDAVGRSLETLEEMWPDTENRRLQARLIRDAMAFASDGMDDLSAIHRLGEGWVGEEALAIAVYCALRYPHDIDRCLIAAVNHKGDSDSTGAIAGNILGAAVGLSGIPDKYTDKLELKAVLLQAADDLWRDISG